MTAPAADQPVRIRGAADLFEVLTRGAMEAQLAVLKSIVEDPRRPMALGRHQGEDIVDLLLRRIPESSGSLKQLQILCLMSYQDPRTLEFMVEEFARSRDAGTVLRLGRRLGLERGFDFFRPFLWDDRSAQALAAARLCSTCAELSAAERLRVAILLDAEYPPPEIEAATLDAWLQELTGWYRRRARELAESTGSGMLALWTRWTELPEEEQLWLARATGARDPELLRRRLAELLAVPAVSYGFVELAWRYQVELPPGLLSSEHPQVRAAAIQAGHADGQLGPFLTESASLPEVLAAAPRGSSEDLLRLLGDSRWPVRALAVDLLIGLDPPPIESLRQRTRSDHLGERVAAAEALRRLGREDAIDTHGLEA